ncbi:MinD/ParA family ATP-binding protein [Microtetraspora malaysiensis]|uniref:MinD/ParA family protein n=1 Tax=Microtetraspora malaysiensis TaxID=161358 RepID=A0ABW6T619_9ACTN
MLIVLCSGGHSPGVTTTGLALTLAWPRDVLFAECDPAGGSLLSGYLVGQPRERGLGEWAVQLRRGADPETVLGEQVYHLGGLENRWVLPGLAEPAQVASVQPLWPGIADTFAAAPGDVIADVGRVGGSDTPTAILIRADQVLVVARPTLVDLSAAAPRLAEIKALRGPRPAPRVLLVGAGPYSRKEVARTLGAEVVDHLPHDPRAAAVLSHGAGNERYVPRSLLLRSARSLAESFQDRAVRDEVTAR